MLVGLAALVGCAQPRQPTGGPPVEQPPQVVEVQPEAYGMLTELDRPVMIRFDSRLSERLQGVSSLTDAVLVSPETGEVRVRRGRRHLQVSLAGGWQPGLVYRVEVLPVLRDLFNNVRTEPVELVFSTGAAIPETAVAGFVEDRITGRPVPGARVEATHGDAGHVYVSLTDSTGFFALRHIPAGGYDLQAWLDRNRNRQADFAEPQDAAPFDLAAADTVVVELALLPRDTTATRLARATVIDSTKIELTFDDYFAPQPGPVEGTARVYLLPDSTYAAGGTLFHATRLDALRALDAEAEAAAAALVPADTAVADTAPIAAPPPAGRQQQPGRLPGREPAQPERPLPARELVLLLDRRLEPETSYFVVVEGVSNIQGVTGGGGTAAFTMPARPAVPDVQDLEPTDPTAPDPDAPPPATLPPDTIPPDSIPPDSIPPDSIPPALPPDTIPPGARSVGP
jgi:hypothetical protein